MERYNAGRPRMVRRAGWDDSGELLLRPPALRTLRDYTEYFVNESVKDKRH